ncbi:MAG: XRE family transcriptional regulator [Clostridia bacterium]|nr:XRE family transcriptional regulator [Clostridia bacterium]
MNKMMQNLAKNLRFYRKSAGMTQQELGEQISYSGKAISKWEAGHVFPPTEALLRLSDILQIDLDSLFKQRENPCYFLGVDGGGTKTKFVLADGQGTVLRETVQGPCNAVNMTREAISAVLSKGIAETCEETPLSQITAFFGIAGAASIQPELMRSIIKRFGFASFDCGTDAANIVSAGLKGRDGLVAIMGTGSVVFTSKEGQLGRIGGYGYLLGDDCSGYELGRALLHAVLAEADGSGRKTLLTPLFERQNKRGAFEVLPEFYKKDKSYVASYAVMLFEAVRAGDAVATEILQRNVAQFATQLKAGRRRFEADRPLPLVLGGSLTKAEDVLLPMVKKELAEENLQIEILKDEPVMGALRLALLLNKGEEA